MYKKLTRSESLIFYFPGGFLIVLSAIFFILDFFKTSDNPNGRNLLIFYCLLAILGIILILVRNQQLRFKEYSINYTDEDFEQALKQTVIENDWRILSRNHDQITAIQRLYFNIYLLITIIKRDSLIRANCIQNPDKLTFELSFGWRKRNIRTFINNLSHAADGTHYFKKSRSLWDLIIRGMAIIGYLSSIMFIILSVVCFYNNEILIGTISGVLGISIIGPALYKPMIKPKN